MSSSRLVPFASALACTASTLVAAACAAPVDAPTPPAGPAILLFGPVPDVVHDPDDDLDAIRPGVQLDVTFELANGDPATFGDVVVTSDQTSGEQRGSFDAEGRAIVRIDLQSEGDADGRTNLVTAAVDDGQGTRLTVSRPIIVVAPIVPPPPAVACTIDVPAEGTVLTVDNLPDEAGFQSSLRVSCTGGAPDVAAVRELVDGGLVLVTTSIEGSDADARAEVLQLRGGIAEAELTFAGVGAHVVHARLVDGDGVLDTAVDAPALHVDVTP